MPRRRSLPGRLQPVAGWFLATFFPPGSPLGPHLACLRLWYNGPVKSPGSAENVPCPMTSLGPTKPMRRPRSSPPHRRCPIRPLTPLPDGCVIRLLRAHPRLARRGFTGTHAILSRFSLACLCPWSAAFRYHFRASLGLRATPRPPSYMPPRSFWASGLPLSAALRYHLTPIGFVAEGGPSGTRRVAGHFYRARLPPAEDKLDS